MSSPTFELNNELVRAGAGAGKTTALTARVLEVAKHFYEQEGRAPKIVVTTFTRKATEELRERLVKKACEIGDARLIDFVTAKSYLHISTIHSVLSLFLRRLGHWLDIDTGFRVADSAQADRLARKVLREILFRKPEFANILEDFNFNQLTGMLRTHASSDGEPFTEIELKKLCVVAVHERAAALERIARMVLVDAQNEKWVEYANHVLQCVQQLKKYEGQFKLADWFSDFESLAKPRYVTKSAPIPEALHDELKSAIKACDELLGPEFDIDNCQIFAKKAKLFTDLRSEFLNKYEEKKSNSGFVEFDDLEKLTLKALRKSPEMAKVFSTEWDYWLIDEFQDTSPIQVELLNGLIGHKPVYVVGDPQQSIYIFRGARSEVFLEKEKEVLQGGGHLSELLKNYRSRPELLLFFNDFFSQLPGAFLPMQAKADQPQDLKDPVAQFCIVSRDSDEPYAALAQTILNRIKNNDEKFDHFCVLGRTNRELYKIAQYFDTLNIPTHVHASDGFYSRREVLDLLSFAKFLVNPYDNLNLIRLLRSPWLRIEDSALVQALSRREVYYWSSVQKKFVDSKPIQYLIAAYSKVSEVGIFETVRDFAIDCGLLTSSHFHDMTGRRESNIWKLLHLMREGERTPGFSYANFLYNAFQAAENENSGEGESDAVAALEPNRVNFMTIHKSKGLKFKHVLLPNMGRRLSTVEAKKHEHPFVYDEVESKFTLAIRLGEERKMTHNLAARRQFERFALLERDEHMRLLYVALTRAEHSVLMHWQDSIDRLSWAAQFKLDLSAGVHAGDKYSYVVSHEFERPEIYSVEAAATGVVREPWASGHVAVESTRMKRISVTRLLDDKFKSATILNQQAEANLNSNLKAAGAPSKFDKLQLQRKIEAPVFGQRIHSFLETLKYRGLTEAGFDRQWLKSCSERWFSKRAGEFEKAVEYVLGLDTPPIQKLILRGEVEWGFQLQTEQGVIEGQIDLWGVIDDTVWVVDYKSGSDKSSERAFAQLELYAEALRARGYEKHMKLAVIYAREEKIEIREFSS